MVLLVTLTMVKLLTAAITKVLAEKGLAEMKDFSSIDSAPEEKKEVSQSILLT